MITFSTFATIQLEESQAVTLIQLLQKLQPQENDLYKTSKIGFEVNIKLTADERELIQLLLADVRE